MVFSSMFFLWVFLPIVLVSYWLIGDRMSIHVRNGILLVASLFFYAWGEPLYILLMILSVTMNYLFARGIGDRPDDLSDAALGSASGNPSEMKSKLKIMRKRKILLTLDVVGNLFLLGYFKYYLMIAYGVNKLLHAQVIPLQNIALPIGISFYTFQSMSYVIDVYRGDAAMQKNYWKVLLYISLFPQLIAGPIVKYRDIAAEIDEREASWSKRTYGMKRFIYGLSKKVILANTFGMYADELFGLGNSDLSTGLIWMKMLLYYFQIYYDFSGYSDMAIGLGSMFGFTFLENFNYPYISHSVKEFWRRWHISLSTWFKEYVYIPLGGNRKGKIRTYLNLLIVFFLTGLWHGASMHFVMWGMFYGAFLVFERIFFGKVLTWLDEHHLGLVSWAYTFLVSLSAWAFFREEGTRIALQTLKFMWVRKGGVLSFTDILSPGLVILLILGVLLSGILQTIFPKLHDWLFRKDQYTAFETVFQAGLLFVCIMILVSSQYNAFIYFRF